MSFILDAIRKSEDERQKNRQPDSHSFQAEGGYRSEVRSSLWRIASFLVALVLLVAIVWWLGPQVLRQFDLSPAEWNSISKDSGISAESVEKSNAYSASPEKLSNPQTNVASSTDNASSPDRIANTSETLPPRHQIRELWELPADFQSLVPDMKFTWHTFGLESSLRSVEINGRMLKEGDRVAAGLKLHVITSTGVIMHYRDRYFFIDVQEKLSQ